MNKWIRSFILLLFALSTQWVQAQNVAKVGSTEYATLQEAINAVPQNGTTATTVTMLNDYTTTHIILVGGRNVKLDLDGKTLTLTAGGRLKINQETLDYDTAGGLTVQGSFFILGGSTLMVTGNGTITTSSSTNPTILNVGTLVIENGTITRTDGSASVIVNNYNGQVTINGGTVVNNSTANTVGHTITNNAGTASNGVMSHPNSKLTVNDGNVSATANKKNAIDNFAIVEVNGGTITGGPVTDGTIPCAAINTHAAAATVTINGGNVFAGNDSEYSKCFTESTGIVTINPTSTFNRDISLFNDNGHVTINGEVINNNNGKWTVGKVVAVAKIGETKYRTLQAAVDAAQQMGGEVTINIIDDISGETVTIPEVANFKLTIDGQKDASSNYTVDALIIVDGLRGNGGSITNGASVTLQNIAFVNGEARDAINPAHYPHDLTIQDCTYTGSDASLKNWFLNVTDGPLYGATVKNVTVEHSRLIQGDFSSEVVFENIVATNDAYCGFNIKTNDSGGKIGTVLIKDCQVTTAKYALRDYIDGYNGTITLEGNTFISTPTESDEGVIVNRGGAVGTAHINVVSGIYTGPVKVLNNKEGVLAISGGYFSEEFPQEYIAADLVAQGKVCAPATDMQGYFTVGDPHYVAQIGETKYVSLAAAVNAVPADGTETTIVMIDDETINSNAGVTIPASKNVVLDLNGKTVTGVVQSAASAQTILNKGTLVVTDSSDEKNGTVTNVVSDENAGSPGDSKNWFSNAITNNGTLTVNAGNIVNTGTGGACYAIDNITNGTLCTPVLNIAGGNVSAKKVAVRMFCNSTTNDNTVNVTGGVISSENAYAIQPQQANNNANKAVLNISGGTFSGQYAFCDYGNNNVASQFDNASYSITGGFFSGYMWSYATSYCGMEGFVSGGYFDKVVGGDIVAPGSACVDNTEEETMEAYPYTIGIADVHYYWLNNSGQIDGGGYYTIYAPFAGPDPVLMDGEFIELQKDVTLTKDIEYLEECSFGDPIFKGGTFTLKFGEYDIDLNGHVFPIPTGVTILTDKQTDIFSALEEGYKVVEEATETGYAYSVVPKTYVAQIGDVLYETLAEAVAAVPTDGTETTILMIDNEAVVAGITIDATKNIVLELNGKTISGNTDSSKTYALITNKGTLTIQDNTDTAGDGTGTGLITTYIANPDGGDVPGYASNTITNNGNLTVKSGKIVNNGSGYACYAIDNQTNGNSYTPTLKIEGGRMQQMNAYTYAVRMFCNSTTNVNSVEISGGVIEGGYGLWLQTPNNKSNKANLVITGGTLNANDGAALYIGGTKADNSNISFDISGTATYINGTGVIIQGPLSGTYGHSSISNGNFVNVQCGANVEKFITGGIYDEVVNDIYIAEGYMCIPYGADKYTVIPIPASSLIVFHDSGNYEQSFEVPMFTRMAGADIYYKVNGGAAQKYSGSLSISEDTELEAWLQVGDTKVGESITRSYAIVEKPAGPSVADNYYYIKNNGNGKYVNVAGRKTVTFKTKAEAEEAAGTVIRVNAVEGGAVKTLRSQAIDLPGYAKRAMNYVPEMVQLVVSKLHADGGGNILGENGVDAIMTKFNESFDYNLYLEEYNGGYRIYGRTPSMKPVVDFYAENKDRVDAKLPELETFINNAIDKLKTKLKGRGESILKPFSVVAVWEAMGGTLTKPEDAESTARFYEEVLASEANVWEFAYQTAMMYYEPLMASETFQGAVARLGDYSKYLDKLPNVRPNFKYYIVADGSKMDFISEGNPNIDTGYATWTLEDRTNFTVKFDEADKLVDGLGTKYYTTLYTDFAYTMPENAKAYAVTSYNAKDIADLEEITGVIPAQTPVLLMTQDEGLEATLTLSTEAGTAPTTNLLKGNDWVVKEYDLQTEQLHDMFELVKEKLGEDFYNNYLAEYEHLLALNAGTVNNKYFFGLKAEVAEGVSNLRQLGVDESESGEMKLGFWENYNALPANKAFLIEEPSPVLIPLWPDVNCDGVINTSDVIAVMDIYMDGDWEGPNWIYPTYNHSVADVNQDGIINVSDAVMLLDIYFELY